MLFDNLKENAIFLIKTPNLRRLSSPHPWGCFRRSSRFLRRSPIFPTPVGVFPVRKRHRLPDGHLPHTRGGVSERVFEPSGSGISSPHPWGCFFRFRGRSPGQNIFPTPVGVFLVVGMYQSSQVYLPHTRGGVSAPALRRSVSPVSSPHPWGCF